MNNYELWSLDRRWLRMWCWLQSVSQLPSGTRSCSRSLFREEKFQVKPLGPGYRPTRYSSTFIITEISLPFSLAKNVTVQLFPLVTIWIVQFVIIENSILSTLSPQSLLYSIHTTFNFGSICQTMLTESTCYGAIFFVWNVFYSPFPFPGKRWIRSIVFS